MHKKRLSRVQSTLRYVLRSDKSCLGTYLSQQIGHATVHIDEYNEDYLITLPPLHIEGLITGSPYVELNSSTYIQSSTGFTAKINYSGKGWLSGKKNTFSAVLYPEGREKDVLYTIDGQWTDEFTIRDAKTKAVVDQYNPKVTKTTPLIVAEIDDQDEMESRRAWKKVADAIVKGVRKSWYKHQPVLVCLNALKIHAINRS
jgi:oxysterol-binding protein-related protein 9/10/11